jgi:RNA polymerase sigma-B factor
VTTIDDRPADRAPDSTARARRRVRLADAARVRADRELFERFVGQGDSVDREMLVDRFLPLARSIASRYVRRGEAFDDIFQVACLGLVNAIDRYDPSRGQAFSSFAVPTIAGEIKRYYRDRTWNVHVPRDLQDLTLAVERVTADLQRTQAHSPTIDEIAARLGVDHEAVLDALQARHARHASSLDAPVHDGDNTETTVGELLGSVEPGFARAEARADLDAMQRILTRRERTIVRLRFHRDMTQQEIGEQVGLSQMQISRILRYAVARLREHAERVEQQDRKADAVPA